MPAKPYGERARPLPPDDRRLAIVATATSMIRRDHAMPTTRALAAECGIAEGTLFRAFATKEALVDAVASTTACPYPLRAMILAIPRELPLRERMLQVTRVLHERFSATFEILVPLGAMGPPRHGPHPGCPGPPGAPLEVRLLRDHIARVLEPDAAQLRVDLDVLIDALRFLAFAGSHTGISDGRLMTPEAIVDLILDGALRRTPSDPSHLPVATKDTAC